MKLNISKLMFCHLLTLISFSTVCCFSERRIVCAGGYFKKARVKNWPEICKCTHFIPSYLRVSYGGVPVKQREFEQIKVERRATHSKCPSLIFLIGIEDVRTELRKATKSQQGRELLAAHVYKIVMKTGSDGISLDWTNLGQEDKQNFTALFMEVRTKFDRARRSSGKNLTLTTRLKSSNSRLKTHYDVKSILRIVDFVTVEGFNLHPMSSKLTGHHSALFQPKGSLAIESVDGVFKYLVEDESFDLNKLNLGIPFFGTSFKIKLNTTEMHVRAYGPATGWDSRSDFRWKNYRGYVHYDEVCELWDNPSKGFYSTDQHVPYIVDQDKWIGFDNVESIADKVCFAKSKKLGGLSIYSLWNDDIAVVNCNRGRFPLFNTVLNIYHDSSARCAGLSFVRSKNESPPGTSLDTSVAVMAFILYVIYNSK